MENEIFEATYIYYICNSKAIKISPNQHAELLGFLYTEDYLEIKKAHKHSVKLHKLVKFHYQAAFAPQVIQ